MEFDSYLKGQRSEGALSDEGSFTVAGEIARRKLAESVPEVLARPDAALAMIEAAFSLLGFPLAAGDSTSHPHMFAANLIGYMPGLRFCAEDREWTGFELDPLWSALEEASEKPFQTEGPVATLLSRAICILTKLKCSAVFYLCGSSVGRRVTWNEELVNERQLASYLRASTKALPKGIALLLPQATYMVAVWQIEKFSPLRLFKKLQQAAENDTKSFLFPMPGRAMWARSPARVVAEECMDYFRSSKGWFDYRTSHAIALEYLVGTQESPIKVHPHCLPEFGVMPTRVSEDLSSWERVVSKEENLILRQWTGWRPTDPEGPVPCRAVFCIALSSQPSVLTFASWGSTLETITLSGVRPGLAAVVHWPELRQSLYGDTWVRDEAFEAAVEWARKEAEKAFSVLASEVEYVWKMIERDHLKRSYKSQVREYLREWLPAWPGV